MHSKATEFQIMDWAEEQGSLGASLSAIIPASGNSSRMGTCKFLMKMSDGKSIIQKIIQNLIDIGTSEIIVVSQAKYQIETLRNIKEETLEKIKFVINKFPEKERFYSLQLGLVNSSENTNYILHDADIPLVSMCTYTSLIQAGNNADIVKPTFEGRSGHPIIINKKVKDHLINCPYSSRLDRELRNFSSNKVDVNDPNILVDIDTPADYQTYI